MRTTKAEKQFDNIMGKQVSLPRSKDRWRPESVWQQHLDAMASDAYPPTSPCYVKFYGCAHTPTKPVMLVEGRSLIKCGVPPRELAVPSLFRPMCDHCKLLYLHLERGYRCKTTWVNKLVSSQHTAPANIRQVFDLSLSNNKARVRSIKEECEEVIETLLSRTVLVELSIGGTITLPADPTLEIVSFSWEDVSTKGLLYIGMWRNEDV